MRKYLSVWIAVYRRERVIGNEAVMEFLLWDPWNTIWETLFKENGTWFTTVCFKNMLYANFSVWYISFQWRVSENVEYIYIFEG
jgi:hypothetical protein